MLLHYMYKIQEKKCKTKENNKETLHNNFTVQWFIIL